MSDGCAFRSGSDSIGQDGADTVRRRCRLRRSRETAMEVGNSGMTIFRGVRALAAAAMVMAALTSCTDEGQDPAASGTPSPSSPAPATSSSTPPSDSEIASEAASAVVWKYFKTVDLVRQDSNRPASELNAVAASSQLTAQKNLLKSQRQADRRQVGETKLVEVKVESVSLDEPATAYVDVCWDVSDVDIVDGDGKSVVTPERKDVGWTRFTVTNATWETAPSDGWRVSGGSDLEKEPCVGS